MERSEAEAVYDQGRDAVVAVLLRMDDQIGRLTERVARQDERISQLERRLGRSSRNSSQPPSQDPPSAEPKRGKGRSGRGQGAQPGHEGRGRELLPVSAVDEVVEHWPDRREQDCDLCDPRGRTRCDRCAGQGSVICDALYPCNVCGGTGRLGERSCSNPQCRDGQIKVPGGAREECYWCDGSGRLWCAACDGAKVMTFAYVAKVTRKVQTLLFEATTPAKARGAKVVVPEWLPVFDGSVNTEPPTGLPEPLATKVGHAFDDSRGETARHLTVWGAALTTVSFQRRGMKRKVTIIGDGDRVVGKRPGVVF